MTINDSNKPLWLCLYFPLLPLQVFTRGINPLEADKPVVVIERRRIIALNQVAIDTGIRQGNNMDTAYSLSHEVISFDKDGDKEHAALANLAQWAYQFSPAVAIRAPDCLLIEIGASLSLFKGLEPLTTQASKELQALGYTAILSLNQTPLAALLSAQYMWHKPSHQRTRTHAPQQPEESQQMANKPSNNTPDNETTRSIAIIPVTYLQVDKAILSSLQQMGIATVGDLLDLPAGSINRRFGVYFTDYLRRLVGEQPDPQKYITQQPHFFSDISFMSDVTNTSALLFPIKRLLNELDAFLTARQLHINQLSWRLSHRNQPTRGLSIYLASPEHNIPGLLRLTQLKLEQVKDVKEVDTLALSVNDFFPANTTSGDLFPVSSYASVTKEQSEKKTAQKRSQRPDNANSLLNLLCTRLGPDACFSLALQNDHRPEKAWQRVSQQHINETSTQMIQLPDSHRPIFLLTPPRVMQTDDYQPYLDGKLTLLAGPERIDFGWWDRPTLNETITRDYYVAADSKSGALYWVFHYVHYGKWYLHGIFS
ncbi:MAG: protein ImuB [Cyclobacteriaceae bacterium]|jgi:protein ImuB